MSEEIVLLVKKQTAPKVCECVLPSPVKWDDGAHWCLSCGGYLGHANMNGPARTHSNDCRCSEIGQVAPNVAGQIRGA